MAGKEIPDDDPFAPFDMFDEPWPDSGDVVWEIGAWHSDRDRVREAEEQAGFDHKKATGAVVATYAQACGLVLHSVGTSTTYDPGTDIEGHFIWWRIVVPEQEHHRPGRYVSNYELPVPKVLEPFLSRITDLVPWQVEDWEFRVNMELTRVVLLENAVRRDYADLLDPLATALPGLRTSRSGSSWWPDWWTAEVGMMSENGQRIVAVRTRIPLGARISLGPLDRDTLLATPGAVKDQWLEVGLPLPARWLTNEWDAQALAAAGVGWWSLLTPCPRPDSDLLIVRGHGYFADDRIEEWVDTDAAALVDRVIDGHASWLQWWREVDPDTCS